MADDTRSIAERVTLDFLEAPSHPELLGRIGRYEIERVLELEAWASYCVPSIATYIEWWQSKF